MMKAAVAVMLLAAIATAQDASSIVPENFEVQTGVDAERACTIDVASCFAKVLRVNKPTYSAPINNFAGNYRTMCGPERRAKASVKEGKKKSEAKAKELCAKNERNKKGLEKQVKLSLKKEKYSKAVAEGKEKYLEKKVKNAQELTVKTANQGKEYAGKAAEKSNKRENVLYKKECASKENAFKCVREGKQKVRIVYVDKPPTPVHQHTPAPIVYKHHHTPKHHHKRVVVKPVVVKPAHVHRPVVVVPAPAPVVKKKPCGLKEVLIKTGEISNKAAAKSAELVVKANTNAKESVTKECLCKDKKKHKDELKEKRLALIEKHHKKVESREVRSKGEVQQKLAAENLVKEKKIKESKTKVVAPIVQKKCSPETSLERYVKDCKRKEEKFAKAKVTNEATIKEVKAKANSEVANLKCSLSESICKQIYSVSHVRQEKMAQMVNDHTAGLKAAMENTQTYEEKEAVKMKFEICASAARDMHYFADKFLYGGNKPCPEKKVVQQALAI